MDKKLKKKLVKEVARCKRDFIYFSENYLYVIDKNNNKVKLKLNSAQNKILAELIKNNTKSKTVRFNYFHCCFSILENSFQYK